MRSVVPADHETLPVLRVLLHTVAQVGQSALAHRFPHEPIVAVRMQADACKPRASTVGRRAERIQAVRASSHLRITISSGSLRMARMFVIEPQPGHGLRDVILVSGRNVA